MARKNIGDCIKTETFSFTSVSGVQTLPANANASKALLQFYTNAAGVAAIGVDVMAYQPLVSLTEDSTTPVASYAGNGIKLFNASMYEVETGGNIDAFKVIAFAAGYTVYCQIHWYK